MILSSSRVTLSPRRKMLLECLAIGTLSLLKALLKWEVLHIVTKLRFHISDYWLEINIKEWSWGQTGGSITRLWIHITKLFFKTLLLYSLQHAPPTKKIVFKSHLPDYWARHNILQGFFCSLFINDEVEFSLLINFLKHIFSQICISHIILFSFLIFLLISFIQFLLKCLHLYWLIYKCSFYTKDANASCSLLQVFPQVFPPILLYL